MAGSTTVKIPGEDGRDREVTLPEYAMDSTLRDLVKAMAGLAGTSEETKKALEKLGKDTNENFKGQTKEDRDREALAQKQLDSLKDLNKTVDNNKQVDDKNAGLLKEAFSGSASIMKNLFLGAISTASTALYNLVSTGYATGSALIDLNRQGVLFGETIDGLTNAQALDSFTALGMSASSAAGLIGDYSRVTATLGVKAITDHSYALGKDTKMGSMFGMTMKELTEYMADELEIRQSLGMIETMDGMRARESARKLFESQMIYSQVLGTAIEDLQKASDATLDDPMFQTMMSKFDLMGESTEDFTNTLRDSQSRMASMGIDSKLIDEIGRQMFDITAFYSDSGQALFSAFASTGTDAGSQVTEMLANINSLVASGDEGDLAEAQAETAKLPDLMRRAIADMGPEGIESFRLVAQEVGGEMGTALMSSINSVRLFNNKLKEMSDDDSTQRHLRDRFAELAMASASFDNAKNGINGAMDTVRMAFTGMLTGPAVSLNDFMTSFSLALVDNSDRISEAISNLVGKFFGLEGATGAMGKKLSDLGIKSIDDAIDKVIEWMDSITAEDISATITKIKDFGIALIDAVDFVVTSLSKAASFFSSDLPDTASFWSKGAELFAKIFGVAFVAQLAMKLPGMLAGKALGAITGGANGPAGAVGKGVGKGAATLGTGLGKGAGGLLKGLSSGLSAMGGKKVFAGIAALTGLGFAMSLTIAPGFKAFTDLNWETMGKAIVGLAGLGTVAAVLGMFAGPALLGALALGAIGLALHLFPVDVLEAVGTALESAFNGISTVITSVFSGVGEIIGKVSDAINSFKLAGAEAENMRLEGATNSIKELAGIDDSRFSAISAGIDSIAGSLLNFSNAVGDDGFFGFGASGADVDKQMEQVSVFKLFADLDATAIQSSADALSSMVDVYTRFGGLDNTAIMSTAGAIKELNQSVNNQQSLGEMVISTGKSIIDFGMNLATGGTESPSTEAMTNASTDGTEQSKASATTSMVMAEINQDQLRELKKILESIDSKTVA